MCGIVGYVGRKKAAEKLYNGLKKLEYRGYDSAGIAVTDGNTLSCIRRAGRIEGIADARLLTGYCGFGHTRWATHGGATDRNAHPHTYGKFTVVHNGIIENYLSLKEELLSKGHIFSSDTDSETVAHLLHCEYEKTGDFLLSVQGVLPQLKGAYALGILCCDCPEELVFVRKKSPLIVGWGEDGAYAASDIPALSDCFKIHVMPDGEIAVLRENGAEFYDFSLRKKRGKFTPNERLDSTAGKGRFPYYMLKEIYEIPTAVKRTVEAFNADTGRAFAEKVKDCTHAYVVGCGTAYHSALVGAELLEKTLKIPVVAENAGEFCYRAPLADGRTLVIAVSQSGETADTVAAVRTARKKGAVVAVITNAGYSTLAGLARFLFVTQAGVEVGVAATKTYCAQLTEFYLLAACLNGRSKVSSQRLYSLCRRAIAAGENAERWAEKIVGAKSVYFLGRGYDLATALEGSLKLREISYVQGAGYAAGELKHGSIALIDGDSVVVAVSMDERLRKKTKNAVNEVLSRGAKVLLVTNSEEEADENDILLPKCSKRYAPLLSVIPLQFLAYYTSVKKGLDPDHPRNLAKSVTVE